MRYVAAYLLATLGGNKNPSASDITAILGSVGIDVESDQLDVVMKELSGKDINEVIEAGKSKLASVPTGGAVMAAASSGGGAAAPAGEKAEEEKKEEKKEEEEEESDDDMGFGLFD
ncbi:60S acidic ribosomal protein P2-like [Stylophora pistillata]|uniref:Large ribosomal subunit protein P2 n=1 Tax=Stylophora pistillata TaxID=50429 RepID=A0A2B4S384_STYPI|nr:60S acidic ribosomal protein P2-like [Stylophora pistillata]PFX22982.1 60S acidic ribosomal protein P2 [Stylophora pistillata]